MQNTGFNSENVRLPDSHLNSIGKSSSDKKGTTMGRNVKISSKNDPISRLNHLPLSTLSPNSSMLKTQSDVQKAAREIGKSKNVKFFKTDENGNPIEVKNPRHADIIIDNDNKCIYKLDSSQQSTSSDDIKLNPKTKKSSNSIFSEMHLPDQLKYPMIKKSITISKNDPLETLKNAKATLQAKKKALTNARIKGVAYRALGVVLGVGAVAAGFGLILGTGGIGVLPGILLIIGGTTIPASIWKKATPLLKEINEVKKELYENPAVEVLNAYSTLCKKYGEDLVNEKLQKSLGTTSCLSLGNKKDLASFIYALEESEKEIVGQNDSFNMNSIWDLLKINTDKSTIPSKYEDERSVPKQSNDATNENEFSLR